MRIETVSDVSHSNAKRLAERYKSLKGHLTVGIHKKDNRDYPDSDVNTATVGMWQEFGHFARGGNSFILPKVWLRIFNLMQAEKDELKKQIKIAFKGDLGDFWQEVGGYMSERIKERIRYNEVTPHSKKVGTTLIDTGQLVNSIDYEVKDV